jgi:Flp pilus assembly protein TadG
MKNWNNNRELDSAKNKSPKRISNIRSSRGQAFIELAIVLPFLILLLLGVAELSYLLYDQHVLIRLSREGSNLISRGDHLGPAATDMQSMVNPPVNLSGSNSKLIFTVFTKYSSGANRDYVIVYQRHEIGGLAATSAFTTQGTLSSSSFGPAPDYIALNPDSNTSLRVTPVPASLTLSQGQFVYVTEIFSRHALITSLNNFGLSLPSTLYSVDYF